MALASVFEGAEPDRQRCVTDIARRILEDAKTHGLEHAPMAYSELEGEFFGVVFRLQRYGLEVDEIALSLRAYVGWPMVVRLRTGDETVVRFLPPRVVAWYPHLIFALEGLLAGDELELDYRLAERRHFMEGGGLVLPTSWWGDWKQSPAGSDKASSSIGSFHRSLIYPAVAIALQHAQRAAAKDGPFTIWCLGAGDGEEIDAQRKALDDDARWVLFDVNDALLEMARRRWGRDPRVTILDRDLMDEDAFENAPPPDAVAAISTWMCSVMTSEQARAMLRRAVACLHEGGAVVAASWMPSLLGAEDYLREGLVVWNTHRPTTIAGWQGAQLYGGWRGSVSA